MELNKYQILIANYIYGKEFSLHTYYANDENELKDKIFQDFDIPKSCNIVDVSSSREERKCYRISNSINKVCMEFEILKKKKMQLVNIN